MHLWAAVKADFDPQGPLSLPKHMQREAWQVLLFSTGVRGAATSLVCHERGCSCILRSSQPKSGLESIRGSHPCRVSIALSESSGRGM